MDNQFVLLIIAIVLVAAFVVIRNKRNEASVQSTSGGSSSDLNDPNSWEIGPIVGGENFSVNMPLHPLKTEDGWLVVPFKGPDAASGHAHYITASTASLVGKKAIIVDWKFRAAPGTKLVPVKFPDAPSILTAYFERNGLKWTADYEAWRWYASFASVRPVPVGEGKIVAPLDSNWTAVLGSSKEKNPQAFQEALADAGRLGFVLGGGDGLGHGVYASGPAELLFKVRVE